ncbi:Utp14-domain-containing protein [Rhodofomes roseus]|uniref:Utp14-domain-containing protein n=1 Tax=Rhodofomes roseus TaxID=34475 RepID=A0ABQ8KHN5_9APHY|nr:Utp14-domain-containing protein [Rhodofomes roseus]KAH9837381.1 Utp14-domain-containing protein [Rhodofomes roseus]
MARAQKLQKFAKKPHAPSQRTSNALGYAKRQAQKGKRPSRADVEDVYEYQQEKVRRAKVTLQYERDELLGARGEGSDEEDEEGGAGHAGKGMRPRLIGEGDDDERIGEDEDEDVDSDEAFDESDEERFAGFGLSQKKKPKAQHKKRNAPKPSRAVRFAEVDLNEDEDEAGPSHAAHEASVASDDDEDDDEQSEEGEEEGDPDEFIDVLDVLDGRGEPHSEDEAAHLQGDLRKPVAATTHEGTEELAQDEDEEMRDGDDEDGEDEEEGEEGDEDEEISTSEEEGEGGDESALDNLERFVTNLDAGHKRKSPDAEDGEPTQRAKKRRLLPERTEAGEENEFAAHVGSGKLQIDDLLAPLAGQSSNLQSLKKSAKILTSQSGPGKTLAAPLPQRTAERLDREAAYEQTKEEVDKWTATMQRIKEAEHLSFPLQAQPSGKTSNLELAAKFKPTTELESAVDKLLKSAKMRDEDIAQTESLKMNHLSVEEVKARRAELSKMRELMFRAEAKAKRVAKIKSKTYRRLKKKEKAKLAAKLGEGASDVDEDDEEVRLKREVERARERATLRHKNTGKWAKAMKVRGELDVDQRREIADMLDRGEKLRRKIQGGSDSDEESDEDSEDDGDEEIAAQRVRVSAFEELAGLEDAPADASDEGGKKGKSIFEMKFMKDAMAREQRKVNEEIDDFVKEMGGQLPDPDADGDDAVEGEQTYSASVQRVGGRVAYRPGPPGADSLRPAGSLASDTSSVTLKSTDLLGPSEPTSPATTSPVTQRPAPLPLAEEVNPWLAHPEDADRPAQKRHEVIVGKNSASVEKSKNKLRKRKEKREEAKEKAKEDAAVDVSMSNIMTLGDTTPTAGPSKQKTAAASKSTAAQSSNAQPTEDDGDSDADSEVEEQEKRLADPKGKGKGKANGVKAFQQRDLVALAFAGDNVVQDFAEAKRSEMQEDAPREVDTTLLGWGSWGGKGAKKAPLKPHLIKKVAGVDPRSRADYGKAHVIISEKRDKKAAKYMVKDLPFPYTSKAQFERSLEAPLGTEWNTRLGFQRATLPRVVTKPGQIIAPLEKQHS